MPQQEERAYRHSASCKYATDLPSFIRMDFLASANSVIQQPS